LFERVRQQPGMYLLQDTYAATAAFVQGYDAAYEGGLLAGFREWLVVRLMTGSNLSWSALVLHAAFPDMQSPQDGLRTRPGAERLAIDALFSLLAEFDEIRKRHDGLKNVFVAYEKHVNRDSSAQ
jgi:hypothetical protein